jgi:integrase
VNWAEELIHIRRSKKGLIPWVPILPEMKKLLAGMKERATSDLIFPSVLNPDGALDPSAFRRLLAKACKQLGIRHVTPHGLRSYFVTQARQSGLTDAEIAQLIGDKTGPSIIAEVYGDVRPDHLLNIARKIQLTATTRMAGANNSITKDKP